MPLNRLNQKTLSYLSGCRSKYLPGKHREKKLSLQQQQETNIRSHSLTAASSLLQSCGSLRAGSRRLFSKSLFISQNIVSSQMATTNQDYDLQSTPTEADTENELRRRNQNPSVALDKFTHFALFSNSIPLGSMGEENRKNNECDYNVFPMLIVCL